MARLVWGTGIITSLSAGTAAECSAAPPALYEL
jgi:hypothetical protein